MNLTVTNYELQNKRYNPTFKGPLDGALTATLRVLDTNEMANAALLDIGAMVTPRTYIDAKKRNKYAGMETFIREIGGTFINCFSAGLFGVIISQIASKLVDSKVKINPNSWFSDDSLKVLKTAWDNGGNKIENYVENLFDSMKGQNGLKTETFKNIDWKNIDWFDENKWAKFNWDNPNYKNIQDKFKTREDVLNNLTKIIKDKNLTKHDRKQIFEILETRLTNALKVNRNVTLSAGEHNFSATMGNALRDIFDMGHDILNKNDVTIEKALKKIEKVNKIKIFGALSLSALLGISFQRMNRKITEKRTGKKGFVGDKDYVVRDKNAQNKDTQGLLWKKLLASAGMALMTIGVMKVKNPKDFVKKLQFTGPISTGNAIKTVYMANIIGRFLASDNNQELKESALRDYLGFLNWLVLGGFAAKGTANLLDKGRKNLFNETAGKGIKHWLNDVSLKTHTEIAAQGKAFAKKNIWKLNVAHIAGLAYSTVALGILLPLLNIKMRDYNQKDLKASA